MGSDCMMNKHCFVQEWAEHGNAVLFYLYGRLSIREAKVIGTSE
jgi:hypothetical protein